MSSSNPTPLIKQPHKKPPPTPSATSPSTAKSIPKPNHSTDPADPNNSERKVPKDVRIAVIGNVDSGKSTMIGVLTSGEFDDGRGSARSRILRHNHEQSNGRTSCSSQHILGFSPKKKPIHQPVAISATPKQKTAAWSNVFHSSANIVTFIDLAGHEKYLKTTISGLTGCFPDYALIVVGANMGISRMTREHIQVAVALSIPLFVVLTKIDICPEKILQHTVKTLVKLLRSPACNNKMPMIIRKKREVRLLIDKDPALERICPIFCVSAVRGDNVDRVNYFLAQLLPRSPWKHSTEHYVEGKGEENSEELANSNSHTEKELTAETEDEKEMKLETRLMTEKKRIESERSINARSDPNYGELEIDETFAVRGVGIVVSGTVTGGRLFANQRLFLGPFTDCTFKEIQIRTVQMKRVAVSEARAGESCSASFRFVKRKEIVDRAMIRKGMVAVSDENNKPRPVWAFTATILVLHHPTTINEGYQPVVHCGNIRQTCTIMKMSKHRLRSGDSALIDMKFLGHPEFLHSGRAVIIREGSTKCIGKVVQLYPTYDVTLSDFDKLKDKFLNRKFEALPTTMIFDESKIVTKDDLHQLEDEMKAMKLKMKKEKKEQKKKQTASVSPEKSQEQSLDDGKEQENAEKGKTIKADAVADAQM